MFGISRQDREAFDGTETPASVIADRHYPGPHVGPQSEARLVSQTTTVYPAVNDYSAWGSESNYRITQARLRDIRKWRVEIRGSILTLKGESYSSADYRRDMREVDRSIGTVADLAHEWAELEAEQKLLMTLMAERAANKVTEVVKGDVCR